MRSEVELLAARLDRSAVVVCELVKSLARTLDPRQGRQLQPVCHEHAMLTDVILQLLTLLGREAESAVQRRFLPHTSLAYGQCSCLSVQGISAGFSSTMGRRRCARRISAIICVNFPVRCEKPRKAIFILGIAFCYLLDRLRTIDAGHIHCWLKSLEKLRKGTQQCKQRKSNKSSGDSFSMISVASTRVRQ